MGYRSGCDRTNISISFGLIQVTESTVSRTCRESGGVWLTRQNDSFKLFPSSSSRSSLRCRRDVISAGRGDLIGFLESYLNNLEVRRSLRTFEMEATDADEEGNR